MTSRRSIRSALCGLVVAAAVLAAPAASAHGMDAGRMNLRLAGDTAYLTLTPQAALFSRFDSNHDGHISRAELKRQRVVALNHFVAGLALIAPDGATGRVIFSDISVPHAHGDDAKRGSKHLRVTLRYRFERAPQHLTIHYAFGMTAPMVATAQRVTPEKRVFRQRPVGPVQQALFDRVHGFHTFLEPTRTAQR